MDYFKESIKEQPNERAWVTYIRAKVTEQNQSFPTLMDGQTGSGKSWSVLRICQELEPDFQLEGNWFFRANEFFSAFNKYYKDKPKRAKIWVMDEAGVDLSSDEWQSKINKIFAKIFSTSRFRNYIFFGTVPFIDFISKKVRKLMQYRMTANYTQKFNSVIRGVVVPRCLQWNDRKEDFYYHKLVKIKENGDEVDINRILLPKPKKALRDEYEKLRAEFSDKLNVELEEQLVDRIDNSFTLPDQFQKFLDLIKGNFKREDIAQEMEVSTNRINYMNQQLRHKGWDFRYTKKGNSIFNPTKQKWEFYPKEKNLNTS